ncbi:MAG: helix-turn-helix transcriptional regulator [Deferribacterales bacterium]
MAFKPEELNILNKKYLTSTLSFMNRCLKLTTDQEFEELLTDIADFLGFKYILYCFTRTSYCNGYGINLHNVSNPKDWMTEYALKGYINHDPVRLEAEIRLERGIRNMFILWDSYDRELSPEELHIIERRKHFGLNYGFSVFSDSKAKDFSFLVSFADKKNSVDERTEIVMNILTPHLTIIRKRLEMIKLVSSLSEREKEVADWIADGKTSWEIATIMPISENTVKFHTKKIFHKLGVSNKQQAIAILLAVRYLSL